MCKKVEKRSIDRRILHSFERTSERDTKRKRGVGVESKFDCDVVRLHRVLWAETCGWAACKVGGWGTALPVDGQVQPVEGGRGQGQGWVQLQLGQEGEVV